jgi:hypothetical protein
MPTLQERMLAALPEEMAMRIFADKTGTITLVATERDWRVLYSAVEMAVFIASQEGDFFFIMAAQDLEVEVREMLMTGTPPIMPGASLVPDRIITITGNRADLFNATSSIARVVAEIQDENPDGLEAFKDNPEALAGIKAAWVTFRDQWKVIEPQFGTGIE